MMVFFIFISTLLQSIFTVEVVAHMLTTLTDFDASSAHLSNFSFPPKATAPIPYIALRVLFYKCNNVISKLFYT